MDGTQFVDLVRRLSARANRRGLLALLTALPALRPSPSAVARERHRQQRGMRARAEACIPSGKKCPAKRPRGKKGAKLGCNRCCQGFVITNANGHHLCGCTPEGQACTAKGAGQCCSGHCADGVCVLPVTSVPPVPPVTPVPVLTYECPGPPEGTVSAGSPATQRYAQTFTATQAGSLVQIQHLVQKFAGSTGDYVVQLLATSSGVPTNVVLAQTTIPNASVPDGESTVTATFAGPSLSVGVEYASAISRPGGSELALRPREGNDCTGSAFTQSSSASTFDPLFAPQGLDLVTSVTVLT